MTQIGLLGDRSFDGAPGHLKMQYALGRDAQAADKDALDGEEEYEGGD